MTKDEQEVLYGSAYGQLPEALKLAYTPKQFAWLTDNQRRDLMQNELDPEYTE